MKPISYARHRFPPDVIRHAVWLYLRFTLSELWLILGDGVNQAADLASGATSIPSRNLTPSMTFGNWVLTLQSSPAFRRGHHQLEDHEARGVLATTRLSCGQYRRLTVENTLSIGFVVRKWSQ